MEIMRFIGEKFSKKTMLEELLYNSRFKPAFISKNSDIVELEPADEYTYLTFNKVNIPAIVNYVKLYADYMEITYHPADSNELVVKIPYNDISSMEIETR
jgi:hypothetical protein